MTCVYVYANIGRHVVDMQGKAESSDVYFHLLQRVEEIFFT